MKQPLLALVNFVHCENCDQDKCVRGESSHPFTQAGITPNSPIVQPEYKPGCFYSVSKFIMSAWWLDLNYQGYTLTTHVFFDISMSIVIIIQS
jgi:hypothetical protein